MIYLKTSKDGKQSKSWLVVFIIICIPCTLGRVGNSSLSIHVLWNEIRTFLSSVVCSKPLTYAVVSLWPDLFQREVYCNHSGRPARGRTVNNINIFWQILVCNMNSLQSVFLKVWFFFFLFRSAQGHIPIQLLPQFEPCTRLRLPRSLVSFSLKMFSFSCCNQVSLNILYLCFSGQWTIT